MKYIIRTLFFFNGPIFMAKKRVQPKLLTWLLLEKEDHTFYFCISTLFTFYNEH